MWVLFDAGEEFCVLCDVGVVFLNLSSKALWNDYLRRVSSSI